MKAKALIDNGKAAEAINLLSPESSQVSDYRFWLILAEARLKTGDFQGATKDFNHAGIISPGSGDYGLARISALKGDINNSMAHLEVSIKSPYRRSEQEIMLDPAFSGVENRPEWRSFWKTERYSFSERKIHEIEYYLSSGNREEALKILDDLRSQYPGEKLTLYATAVVENAMQKYPEALTILSNLLSQDGKNEDFLRLMASVQISSGNPAGASDTYSLLLANGVIDGVLYLRRAECYRKTGETEKAVADLDRYLSMYPESKEALSLTGKLTAEKGDNLKAIDFFTRNLKLHPDDPQCYIDRANSYFNAGSWEYAADDYSLSLDIKPDNGTVWVNKGLSLLKLGRTEDACHDFRRALALGNKKAAGYINSNCIK